MKLVSYIAPGLPADPREGRVGILTDSNHVVDLAGAGGALSALDTGNGITMLSLLRAGDEGMDAARGFALSLREEGSAPADAPSIESVQLLAPVPRPTSMRDGYAFRQHVEAARRNRGVEMIAEFDLFPVFYFTNHQAVSGPGPVEVQEDHMNRLDFELECAIVIGREGRNILAGEADNYIAGYTIMNDWSARAMQMEEMKLSLGPAKGKDFATSIGPWLVTRDELSDRLQPGDTGERYDLTMVARVNGVEVSRGNLIDMTWTFAQIIERASYGVTLYHGDVIGSGTVGTGCFLELNGSKITDNQWLKDGDTVECEVESLGLLTNTVRLVEGRANPGVGD